SWAAPFPTLTSSRKICRTLGGPPGVEGVAWANACAAPARNSEIAKKAARYLFIVAHLRGAFPMWVHSRLGEREHPFFIGSLFTLNFPAWSQPSWRGVYSFMEGGQFIFDPLPRGGSDLQGESDVGARLGRRQLRAVDGAVERVALDGHAASLTDQPLEL